MTDSRVRLALKSRENFAALSLHDKNDYLQALARQFCEATGRQIITLDKDALGRLRAIDNFLVRPEDPQVRPTSEFHRPPGTAKPKQGRPVPVPEPELISPVPPTAILAPMFRTSVYFHRAVHDVLRDIAHNERRSITDLINEGLVLLRHEIFCLVFGNLRAQQGHRGRARASATISR
jgi:hypothetical protein